MLGGCGVGRIGVVDYDEVEVSNLHRQVAHSEARVGLNKAESIKVALNGKVPDILKVHPLWSMIV